MDGVIRGGWEFVWAAYGVVWGGLVFYGVRLFWQRKAAQEEAKLSKEAP